MQKKVASAHQRAHAAPSARSSHAQSNPARAPNPQAGLIQAQLERREPPQIDSVAVDHPQLYLYKSLLKHWTPYTMLKEICRKEGLKLLEACHQVHSGHRNEVMFELSIEVSKTGYRSSAKAPSKPRARLHAAQSILKQMRPEVASWQQLVESFMREKELDRERSDRGRRNGLLD